MSELPLAILMRHGQADNNVRRILVGRHIESHLTEYGKRQVADTAMYLKNISISKVYTSPVIRTVETAKIVCKILELDYEVDERLYEIELGKLVGMNFDEIVQKFGNLFLKFYDENDSTLTPYGVESFCSVKSRIKNLLDEITRNYREENVLLISHLDPIKAAISSLLELNPQSLYNWHIHNASLTILKYQSNVWSLRGVNVMGLDRYVEE
ncbi:MAG TPA: histidine phosphatase family protein [Nitrososphaeraceae archaeon]|nr:histidine phosphatase family protein [Nitrososphaeraceae archaeon]